MEGSAATASRSSAVGCYRESPRPPNAAERGAQLGGVRPSSPARGARAGSGDGNRFSSSTAQPVPGRNGESLLSAQPGSNTEVEGTMTQEGPVGRNGTAVSMPAAFQASTWSPRDDDEELPL